MTSIYTSHLRDFINHHTKRSRVLCLSFLCCSLITSCGGGDNPTSAPSQPVIPPTTSLSSAQQFVSQQAVALQSLTQDQDFSDLKPIAEAVGKARIVQLGESSHGSGSMN